MFFCMATIIHLEEDAHSGPSGPGVLCLHLPSKSRYLTLSLANSHVMVSESDGSFQAPSSMEQTEY